jgi:hypothetical protein
MLVDLKYQYNVYVFSEYDVDHENLEAFMQCLDYDSVEDFVSREVRPFSQVHIVNPVKFPDFKIEKIHDTPPTHMQYPLFNGFPIVYLYN